MDKNNLFFHAYQSYKKAFLDDRDDLLFKKANKAGINHQDYISAIKVECNIEDDWVNAAERGVFYMDKAIREDRQFIRNEGDVLPIERIRRVSKDSITDLSKHSNYITKMPEDNQNVIPEKLLMVTRENDYATYENRVLYTTLIYLKDFVSTRLDAIKDVNTQYEGNCYLNKKIEVGNRKLDYQLSFKDIRKNDEIASKNNRYSQIIQKITDILNSIMVLLSTNLMQEMSKVPMVSRPIIKTNVLKMNNNFKETLACFEFISGYNKPGYEIKNIEEKICPLTEKQQDSFADIMLLSTFLTYQYNNHIDEELENNYLQEQKEMAKEANDLRLKSLIDNIEKYQVSGKGSKEYIIDLEDAKKELEHKIQYLKDDIEIMLKKHQKELDEEKNLHQLEVDRIAVDQQERIDALVSEYEEKIANLKEEYENKLEKLEKDYANLQKQYDESLFKLESYKLDKEPLFEKYRQEKMVPLEEKCARLNDELILAKTELFTFKIANGMNEEDISCFTTEERFNQLETAKNVLDKFFDEAWEETKKAIRKKHLGRREKK